jgi:hypothetical protein
MSINKWIIFHARVICGFTGRFIMSPSTGKQTALSLLDFGDNRLDRPAFF